MRTILAVAITMLFISTDATAAHLKAEKEYQQEWCSSHGGVQEFQLNDRSRVDCLTDEFAVEVEFASKWPEAVGQALYYALMTGRKPGIVLIMEYPDREKKFYDRIRTVCDSYGIMLWVVQYSN